ncbi:hypothetical protein AVEN_226451-1 [Araneus ventricosus]|uniref:Uncharacterized protein n=1 Tax=Araneus ventricosus TaxID=182803 RepID=A0A4Y2MM94_ARAVE|nr:hypothetical protein AVEN_226451-1 [Araneus ventricosus]
MARSVFNFVVQTNNTTPTPLSQTSASMESSKCRSEELHHPHHGHSYRPKLHHWDPTPHLIYRCGHPNDTNPKSVGDTILVLSWVHMKFESVQPGTPSAPRREEQSTL